MDSSGSRGMGAKDQMSIIAYGDNLPILKQMGDKSVDLIYTDPPFNTGKVRELNRIKVVADTSGDRIGFGEKRYKTSVVNEKMQFDDKYDSYIDFLRKRMIECHRILKDDGSLFLHVDCRESHYCKVMLDQIFDRENFMNEIIWAWDYGGKSKSRWSVKHNNIFWYAKDSNNYTFNYNMIDRIPYMAPKLAGEEKAKRGKIPTSCWFHSIVGTNSRERTGYPTQKPLGVLERIVKVHSNEGDVVLDPFSGTSTLGEAAARHDRTFIMIDNNADAIKISRGRLSFAGFTYADFSGILQTDFDK